MGWDGVLVVEVERLARGDTVDQGLVAQAFKYSNTKIITPSKIYDPNNEFDEEYFEFGLFMSRREYKTINRRLNRGRLASISEGKYIANKPPFGYQRIKLENQKGFSLKIVEDEAKIVKLIFEYFTIGKLNKDGVFELLGCAKIAKELNLLGIKTAADMNWNYNSVGIIIRNPVYIGKIKWGSRPQVKNIINGEVIISRPRKKLEDISLTEGLHQSLISEEQFYLAQDILNNNKKYTIPSRYTNKNPLAGIVVCSICEKKMTRRPYNNGYNDTLLCSTTGCNNASSFLHLVETSVLSSLVNHLEEFKIQSNNNKLDKNLVQDKSVSEISKSAKKELEKLQTQFARLYDLLEQGTYTTDVFIKRSNIITEKITALEEHINFLEIKCKNENHKDNLINNIIPRIEYVLENYHKSDVKKKNELLKSVIDKVLYTKKTGGRWKVSLDDFTTELYPKM